MLLSAKTEEVAWISYKIFLALKTSHTDEQNQLSEMIYLINLLRDSNGFIRNVTKRHLCS